MIIGCLDWSLIRWKQPTIFSLELMKLAHYHKVHQRDIVKMLFEFASDQYDKVYINKDYEDYLYPEYIMTDPKVTYNGLAISNNKYVAMDEIIENRPADTSLYEDMFKYYRRNSDGRSMFNRLMSACHLRMSLDGEGVSEFWDKQLIEKRKGRLTNVILHDKEVTKVRDSYKLLEHIRKYYGMKSTKIGFKFPLIVTNNDSALLWGRFEKTIGVSNIHFHDLIEDEVLEDISLTKQRLTYVINNRYWTLSKFINEFPRILLQGMFLSKWAIPLLLKIEDDFLLPNEWHQMVNAFNAYIKNCVAYRNTLVFSAFTYMKYCYLDLQKEEKVHLFKYIKEEQPDLFNFLYNVEYVTFEKNRFVPHMYTWGEIEEGGGYGGYYYQKGQKNKKVIEDYSYGELITPNYLYLD